MLQELGDYKICFDNKFSYVSSKTIYFEIINENEEVEYDDLAAIFGDLEEDEPEIYEVQVADIEVSRMYKTKLYRNYYLLS